MRLLFGFVYRHFNYGKPQARIRDRSLPFMCMITLTFFNYINALSVTLTQMYMSTPPTLCISFSIKYQILVFSFLVLCPSWLLSYSCPQVNRAVGREVSASLWIKWRGERRARWGCRGGDEAVGLTRARHDDLPQCVSQLAWVTLMKAHMEANTHPRINKVILTRVSSKIPSFVHRKVCLAQFLSLIYPCPFCRSLKYEEAH